MTGPPHELSDDSIEQMIIALDSLVDGDRAAEQLISLGPRVVPAVERFLVASRPRSISVSRCRAVRILGALGAYSSLNCYLRENIHPSDATVLFAEDAVRSAAARELRVFLEDEDRDCVISAASLGLNFASAAERPSIFVAMLDASAGMNWAQETMAVELLDKWPILGRQVAREIHAEHSKRGEKPNRLSPFWRILHHVLGDEIQGQKSGAV